MTPAHVDDVIANRVFGLHRAPAERSSYAQGYEHEDMHGTRIRILPYSQLIEAAWAVMQKLRNDVGARVALTDQGDTWRVVVADRFGQAIGAAQHAQAPMALCLAIVQALPALGYRGAA